MTKEKTIDLIEPQAYDEVGISFVISGYIPKSWLKSGSGISLDFIDIDCQIFMGSSINIKPPTYLAKLRRKLKFSEVVSFWGPNVHSLKKSQGRIAIKLSACGDYEQSICVPLIVKIFEPKDGTDPEIIKKHKTIESRFNFLEKRSKEYMIELSAMYKLREKEYETNQQNSSSDYWDVQDNEILDEFFGVLEYSEDEEWLRLNEKYKDALEWSGPLCRGEAGRENGFVFRVYSNDHDKHFHVMHKERGIDARFSFPSIELISYKKSKNIISKKQQNSIYKFFQLPKNFEKLEREFKKRN